MGLARGRRVAYSPAMTEPESPEPIESAPRTGEADGMYGRARRAGCARGMRVERSSGESLYKL